MNIFIYAKNTEDITSFDTAINALYGPEDSIYISTENRRCFRELESVRDTAKSSDVIIIADISSLGMNTTDIIDQLQRFISNSKQLAICSYPATYKYGISQPMNKALLTTISQTLQDRNKNTVEIPRSKKSNSGRTKMAFPDNWDKLYDEWVGKKISSKEFIEQTGLKKATFYNLLTEYRELQKLNDQYIERYKSV